MATSDEKPKDFVETIEVPEEMKKKPLEKSIDNNLTMSTQLSTEQLICKSPQDSSRTNSSVNSSIKGGSTPQVKKIESNQKKSEGFNVVLYTGLMQVLFGFLMVVFGVLVILHDASLSQIGGGLWGGCLATATGVVGILASAKQLCPLKETPQRVAHTVYLALSLISLAVSQLVLVLAATGLARDMNKQDVVDPSKEVSPTLSTAKDDPVYLPENYLNILSSVGLVLVSAIECICAAISSYQGARAICPCFQRGDENYKYGGNFESSHALVNSWLGKHNVPPHLYVVAAPSSIGKHSKISGGLPVFAMQPPPLMSTPPVIPYPLIPAPLGPIPSPIIPPQEMDPRHHRHHRKYSPKDQAALHREYCRQKKSRSRSKSKEKSPGLTTEDVTKTYTGLDRVIAEEFIEICDSRNHSMCNDSSCQSSCNCQSGCTNCSSSSSNSELNTTNYK